MDENEKNDDGLDEGDKSMPVYPVTKIKITRDQYSISELKKQFEVRKNIVIPEFQRNYAWTQKQQCELIESIMMGIPLPVIYLFEGNDGKKQVVDGRQRLITMLRYMNDEFALTGLKILPKENGKKFSALTDSLLQGKIEDYQIQVYIIQPPTSEQLKYDIFDRVNRGGTRLNEQEMRNALHQGKSTELLINLAESKEFKQATGESISAKKMKDRYIILRFLSFYMLWKKWSYEIEYRSDINDFLAKSMDFINKLPEEKVKELREVFIMSMKLNYEILGADAFRVGRQTDGKKRKPINMALFEALAYFFSESNMNLQNKEKMKSCIDLLKKEFDDNGFSQQVDSSTKVNYRFEKVIKLQQEFINV